MKDITSLLFWEKLSDELGLSHPPRLLRVHFQRDILPNIDSFRNMIDQQLVANVGKLLDGASSGGPTETPKTVSAGGGINENTDNASNATTERLPPPNRRLAFEEVDKDESIDVVGFTQSPLSPQKMSGEGEEEAESNGQKLDLDAEDEMEDQEKRQPASAGGGEPERKNDESRRLDDLKKSTLRGSSGESSILLTNRCLGTSSREAAAVDVCSDGEMDSFEKLFHNGREAASPLPDKRTPAQAKKDRVESRPKQAETIEEVVAELSSFYAITPEVARKALRDSKYSLKSAICRIVRGKAVSVIDRCHREAR